VIRRHLAGIEHELAVDPPRTAVQWVWAMGEVSKEMAASFEAGATAPRQPRRAASRRNRAVGETLTVTLGNWDGEPTDYSFAWQRDGSQPVGSNTMNYRVDTAGVGPGGVVVSAINARGSTAAPPSNAVAVAAAGAARQGTAQPQRPPAPPAPGAQPGAGAEPKR
jgi:hypothetical protein